MKLFATAFLGLTLSVFALAETAAPVATGLKEGLSPFIPMILIFGIFYFLILRPQQKKTKMHQQFLTQLKRGDMVVTAAGIIGTVKAVSDKIVTIEVDDNVNIKVVRTQILENASTLKEDAKSKLTESKTSPV